MSIVKKKSQGTLKKAITKFVHKFKIGVWILVHHFIHLYNGEMSKFIYNQQNMKDFMLGTLSQLINHFYLVIIVFYNGLYKTVYNLKLE